ncbi:MAG TPA: mechanosensitive ion channel family protein [Candidatus Binataceae bacterium]|nr:mechanosensitive ion channel family protein [Candidatus Binataceae bacterium]
MHASLSQIIEPALEGLLALAAALSAVAFRRRTRVFTPSGFIMLAVGLMLNLLTPHGAQTTTWSPYLRVAAITLICCGVIRLILESVEIWMRRRHMHVSTIATEFILTLSYAATLLIVSRMILNFDIRQLVALPALFTLVGAWLQHRDLFSGLLIQSQRPFRPGDWVRIGDHVGQVQETGWQATRILTRTRESVTIPSNALAKDLFINYSVVRPVADEIFLDLGFAEAPGAIETAVRALLADVPDVVKDPPPEVGPCEYTDGAVRYRIRYWLTDYGRQEIVRARIIRSLWYVLRRHRLAPPTHPVAPSHPSFDSVAEPRLMEELRRVDLLKELSDADLRIILPSIKVADYGRGEVLIRQGEVGDRFFILRRGTAEAVDEGSNGRGPIVVGFIEHSSERNFFGEMALLKGEPRNATIRAATDVEVLEIERTGLTHLFRANPEIAQGIARIAAAREQENLAHTSAAHNSPASVIERQSRTFQTMRRIFDF